MLQNEIKSSFVELGNFLRQFSLEKNTKDVSVLQTNLFYDDFISLIQLSQSHNGWFTPEQVYFSVQSWAKSLTENNLNQWLCRYDFFKNKPKKVGLVMAGNIPLVGFHDFLSVLISGHDVLVKTSSNDQHLLKFLVRYLISIQPKLKSKIVFIEGKLESFDAVIATGSNNTARYFEYYFKDVPNIIRKNRNSVAILDGTESHEDLVGLGEDIFRYFGLGCRNVSKIFVPKGYNFDTFFKAMYEYRKVIQYKKYANNYDYNKAVFLMSNFQILDNEFLTIKEDSSYSSPISTLFYEFYDTMNEIKKRLNTDAEQIQCVVSNNLIENSICFGQTQHPRLWDYADKVDTLSFLSKI